MVRRNLQKRSLSVAYDRPSHQQRIFAGLLDVNKESLRIQLDVTASNTQGIELRLPSFLSGVFYLTIEDGSLTVLQQIALQ